MLTRQRPPALDAIPSKPVREALAKYLEAEAARLQAAREHEQAVRAVAEARKADHSATTAALAAGRAVPAATHQAENAKRIELAERVRDARVELATAAWTGFLEQWDAHRDEMRTTLRRLEAKDRQEHDKAIDQLEAVTARRAARANVRAELGDGAGPAEWLVIPADKLRVVDGPGVGYVMLEQVVGALRQLGLPEPERITNPAQLRPGEHTPLYAQGVVSGISAPGGPGTDFRGQPAGG
jgi:hypothetical protein